MSLLACLSPLVDQCLLVACCYCHPAACLSLSPHGSMPAGGMLLLPPCRMLVSPPLLINACWWHAATATLPRACLSPLVDQCLLTQQIIITPKLNNVSTRPPACLPAAALPAAFLLPACCCPSCCLPAACLPTCLLLPACMPPSLFLQRCCCLLLPATACCCLLLPASRLPACRHPLVCGAAFPL